MGIVHVSTERVIPASPEAVYETLADYRNKRPLLLTPHYTDYQVNRDGKGEGTIFSYRLRVGNRERLYRMKVDEAVKGQRLTEKDMNSSLVTTWDLIPQESGQQTRVKVTTEWQGSKGIGGFFERTFAPLGLRSVYNSMLQLLTFVVRPETQQNQITKRWSSGLLRVGLFSLVAAIVALVYILIQGRKHAVS